MPADDQEALRAVAARVFGRPRPYTVTSLGGPTLVWALLEQRGRTAAAVRLAEALDPVMRLLEVDDVAGLPAALDRFRGRPPDVIAGRLRTREVASALQVGLEALGWPELVGLLGAWWPDPPLPVEVPAMGERDRLARCEVAGALAARVALFREVMEVDPAAWDMPPADVDPRVRGMANELLSGGEVLATSRYPNRVGRLLAAAAADQVLEAARLRDAGLGAGEVVAEAVCVLGAVAEAVCAPAGVGSMGRLLPVPSRLVPPAALGWWPSRWWPVLEAWGAMSVRSRSRVRTVWRLSPAAGDVVVAALLWAVSAIGAAAAAGQARSPAGWRRRWVSEMDGTWAPVAGRVWGLVQSVRPVGERSLMPFADGMGRGSWSRAWEA